MKNGYFRIGSFTPEIRVCDVDFNKHNVLYGIDDAYEKNVEVLVFPELCLTGSTAGDFTFSELALTKSKKALKEICDFTLGKEILVFLGLPLSFNGVNFNTVAAIFNGEVLCFIPKTNNIKIESSFYVDFYDKKVVLSDKVIFTNKKDENLRIGVEIGDQMYLPNSPHIRHAQQGATLMVNCASFAHTIENNEKVKRLVSNASLTSISAYALCNAGEGESTGDQAYAGNRLIAENGNILSCGNSFTTGLTFADVDFSVIASERRKIYNLSDQHNYSEIEFSVNNEKETQRVYDKYPFIPKEVDKKESAKGIIEIQAEGLKRRLMHTSSEKLILGLSGGLDSTLALIVAVEAVKRAGKASKDVIAVTMPCFGTTSRTYENSIKLAKTFGVTLRKIDIGKSVKRHFKDIGHSGEKFDAAYENGQARERTQVLMDIANMEKGLVVGTGDMSELALGWATYNGDHMSMYGVNCGIPKTLVKFLVRVFAINSKPKLKGVLLDVLDTPVSPELIPTKNENSDQKTEDLVGPYALHDFFLYYAIFKGVPPCKVYKMAVNTFNGEFDGETIKKWLGVFLRRFFSQQFKRSCLPDGVKVFDFSLSPRNGFKMPSDAVGRAWIDELEKI